MVDTECRIFTGIIQNRSRVLVEIQKNEIIRRMIKKFLILRHCFPIKFIQEKNKERKIFEDLILSIPAF